MIPTEDRLEIQQPAYEEKYTNQHSRKLKELEVGDTVRIWRDGRWKSKAQVIKKYEDTPRSYVVETENGCQYRRNRMNLLKTLELFESDQTNGDMDDHELDCNDEIETNQRHEMNCEESQENDISERHGNFNPGDFRRFSTRTCNPYVEKER